MSNQVLINRRPSHVTVTFAAFRCQGRLRLVGDSVGPVRWLAFIHHLTPRSRSILASELTALPTTIFRSLGRKHTIRCGLTALRTDCYFINWVETSQWNAGAGIVDVAQREQALCCWAGSTSAAAAQVRLAPNSCSAPDLLVPLPPKTYLHRILQKHPKLLPLGTSPAYDIVMSGLTKR